MLVKSESPVDRWCIISPYFVGLSTILLVVLIKFRNQFGHVWSSGMTFHAANHPVTGRAFFEAFRAFKV